MKKDFLEWLKENCPYWFLLSQTEEETYFSKWFDECYQGKECEENEMV